MFTRTLASLVFAATLAACTQAPRTQATRTLAPKQPASAEDRDYEVYALQHLNASEVEATLESFLSDATAVEGLTPYRVQADVETNSLLFWGPPTRREEIKALLMQLDRAPSR